MLNRSQFFIILRPTVHLNGKHVVFGEVVDGFQVLDLIEGVDVDGTDRPHRGQEVVISDR